eukprot:681405-Pyramimonas_sp.AAC.1
MPGPHHKEGATPSPERAMVREAIRHLNIIVRQYMKLSGRGRGTRVGGGNRARPDQGPPCATIPTRQSLLESRLVEGQHANLGGQILDNINNVCNERAEVG